MLEYLLYSVSTHIFCILIGVYIGVGLGMKVQKNIHKKAEKQAKNEKIWENPEKNNSRLV